MKLDQVFGFLLILLAIYLGINATGAANIGPDLFNGSGSASGGGGGSGTTAGQGGGGGGDQSTGGGGQNGGGGGGQNGGGGAQVERAVANSEFCAGAPNSSSFDDLGPAHDDAIRCMEEAGVVSGTSPTVYAPGDAVTRGQAAEAVAAMIDKANEMEAAGVNLAELPSDRDPRFTDVPADDPHAMAIARLNATPILQGYVDARFEPDGKITRAQMASLLDRAYQYTNDAALPIGPDAFRDDERSVHEESINAVAAAEIMQGVTDQRFAPSRSVLRGQMASHLARIMVRMEDKGRITPLP